MNRKPLENPFTPDQIKHRKGNFNRTLAYIEAPAIIFRLNDAFDAAWSFEIKELHILQGEVLVLGKLTAEGTPARQGTTETLTKTVTHRIIHTAHLLTEKDTIPPASPRVHSTRLTPR